VRLALQPQPPLWPVRLAQLLQQYWLWPVRRRWRLKRHPRC
jgi:hypothetical protein